MTVSADFDRFALEQLGQVGRVTSRRMFGGVGYYAEGLIFALADDDTLYFKVDPITQPDFEAEGMKPFRPFGPDTAPMGYWELPARVLEAPDELEEWMRRALAVSRRAAGKPRPGGTPKKAVRKPAKRAGSGRGPSSSRS